MPVAVQDNLRSNARLPGLIVGIHTGTVNGGRMRPDEIRLLRVDRLHELIRPVRPKHSDSANDPRSLERT